MNDELVERAKQQSILLQNHGQYFIAALLGELADRIEALTARAEAAEARERAAMTELNGLKDALAQVPEFICRKCGRRQDGPTDNEARF